MASLREIGQGLADVAREVGGSLRAAGTRVLDADLSPFAEFAGMLLLVSVVAIVVVIGWHTSMNALVARGWGPHIKKAGDFLGKALAAVFFTTLFVIIVTAWASRVTTMAGALGLMAFIASMVGLWWLARRGRAARDAESQGAESKAAGHRQ